MTGLFRGTAIALVGALVAACLIVTSPSSGAVVGRQPHLLRSSGALSRVFEGQDGFPDRHNGNGQWHSGGRAVAHHAGGV
ncbi:MAG TPA: hypothetical protein VFK89_10780, partial [Actinomycetota bacterium]|nr:hypothetical protein [Actinomycetota bacterium]